MQEATSVIGRGSCPLGDSISRCELAFSPAWETDELDIKTYAHPIGKLGPSLGGDDREGKE
jgi:hypothetical protein